YTEQDFEAEAKRLTGGLGLQVVYDSVGKTTFEKGLNCLTRRGMTVLYGQSSGPIGSFDPQVLSQKGSLFLTRPTIAHYIATRAELVPRAGEVLPWVKSGTLTLGNAHHFSLAEAAEAHPARPRDGVQAPGVDGAPPPRRRGPARLPVAVPRALGDRDQRAARERAAAARDADCGARRAGHHARSGGARQARSGPVPRSRRAARRAGGRSGGGRRQRLGSPRRPARPRAGRGPVIGRLWSGR